MKLKYDLDAKIPARENVFYTFQQAILFVASAVVMPVVVGYTIGLNQEQVGEMLQRTFFLCGIMTILQLRFGHRFPIQDGPAGLWSGLYIIMATALPGIGTSLDVLRSDLEMGLLIGGGIVVALALTGVINKISVLFTPIINGLLIILMVIQISQSIVNGMLGIGNEDTEISYKSILIALITMTVILLINTFASGFIKSIATFIGMIVGWCAAALLGETKGFYLGDSSIFYIPKVFAWGRPTFDFGTVLTCAISAVVLLSMVFASIYGMAETIGADVGKDKMRNTTAFHGLATVMAGIFSSVGFMPYVSSIGVVQLTGVAARRPMYAACLCMIAMGMIAPFGLFFSTIPTPVGNGALIMIFAMCIGQALNEFKKVEFSNRESLIVGISMIIGIGMMFVPGEVFNSLPTAVACILSNGLIVGMLVAIMLEHGFMRAKAAA